MFHSVFMTLSKLQFMSDSLFSKVHEWQTILISQRKYKYVNMSCVLLGAYMYHVQYHFIVCVSEHLWPIETVNFL